MDVLGAAVAETVVAGALVRGVQALQREVLDNHLVGHLAHVADVDGIRASVLQREGEREREREREITEMTEKKVSVQNAQKEGNMGNGPG